MYSASVIGGGLGGKLSIRALAASERFDLRAVCDRDPAVLEALSAEFPRIRTFTSAEAMFGEVPTDVTCVSTYADTHHSLAMAAIEHGTRGLLVEKPLAPDAATGHSIVEAIATKGLPMVVPHNILVAEHVREIIERTRAGEIGDLLLLEIENDGWDISSAGIHWFAFVTAVTGSEPMDHLITACDTTTRTYRDGMQVETESVTYVVAKSGTRIVLHIGDTVPIVGRSQKLVFRMIGTAGSIEFWGFGGANNLYRITNAQNPSGMVVEPAPAAKAGHQIYLESMADQMDGGTPDYTIPRVSARALELVEAAYLSHRHRCLVSFPVRDFSPPKPTDWDPGTPYGGSGGGRDGKTFAKRNK